MIPKTKEKPKRENFKSFDKFSAAMVAWRKSKPKAGATKTIKTRKGSKYITTTMVWNGSKWVKKGDSSLVPSRAGKNEGNTPQNKKLKIKAQQEKDKKIPKQLTVSDEAKQDLKDQSSDKFGGKLPKQKLKIKPSPEAEQDLKDQASDKFGGKLPNKKKDPLANYRRGKGTKLGKDTRITKKLKKSGFTEDRLAGLRKKNAEFQAAKKDKKKMKAYREKYGKR